MKQHACEIDNLLYAHVLEWSVVLISTLQCEQLLQVYLLLHRVILRWSTILRFLGACLVYWRGDVMQCYLEAFLYTCCCFSLHVYQIRVTVLA